MRGIKRNQITRWFLLILLSALFLFELHAVLASFSLLEGSPYQEQFVLRSAAVDQLCPIRLPEKITLHEEASKDWEQWNKRGSRQIAILLIFCIVFSFLLLSRITVFRRIPESTNLPHIRVLRFIHQKDGKGSEKSTLLSDQMIDQICSILALSPADVDFQFDIYPDGSVGESFAIDTLFPIEQPESVLSSFYEGKGAEYMDLLMKWNIADERWKKGVETVFAKRFPYGDIVYTVFPRWTKVRWTDTKLQPSKMYLFIKASEKTRRDCLLTQRKEA